jgi:hypothetical protein
VRLDIVEARHREKVEVTQVEAVQPGGFVDLGVEPPLVTHGGADVGDAGRPAGHTGQLYGVVHE